MLTVVHGNGMKQQQQGCAHLALKVMVNVARHELGGLGEQVVEQTSEDAGVVRGELAQVEVAQRTQQDLHMTRAMQLVQAGGVLHSRQDLCSALDDA